jgi:cephalosporin hydroxylase
MTLSGEPALQNERELSGFIGLLQRERVTRFLEIGSRYGDTLWAVGTQLPWGSTVVSVDLPLIKPARSNPGPYLRACIDRLRIEKGCASVLLSGDSRDPEIVGKARALAPFDCVFIDGDHSLAGVAADFENYSPMARMVAFHDINPKQPKPGRSRIEVPEFWQRIRQGRRSIEIRHQSAGGGIGVVWM